MKEPIFHDVQEDLIIGEDQDIITTEQYLGMDYWNELAEAKDNFHFRLNGLTQVASIPEAVVNKWLREGFDFWNAPANEILKKLRLESYDKFIISGDKTFDH